MEPAGTSCFERKMGGVAESSSHAQSVADPY